MCAFYCFICNDYHGAEELGGTINNKPVCEIQVALVVALGEKLGLLVDLRKQNLTTVGKEEFLRNRIQVEVEASLQQA